MRSGSMSDTVWKCPKCETNLDGSTVVCTVCDHQRTLSMGEALVIALESIADALEESRDCSFERTVAQEYVDRIRALAVVLAKAENPGRCKHLEHMLERNEIFDDLRYIPAPDPGGG